MEISISSRIFYKLGGFARASQFWYNILMLDTIINGVQGNDGVFHVDIGFN